VLLVLQTTAGWNLAVLLRRFLSFLDDVSSCRHTSWDVCVTYFGLIGHCCFWVRGLCFLAVDCPHRWPVTKSVTTTSKMEPFSDGPGAGSPCGHVVAKRYFTVSRKYVPMVLSASSVENVITDVYVFLRSSRTDPVKYQSCGLTSGRSGHLSL
jgi:hypothetical protein